MSRLFGYIDRNTAGEEKAVKRTSTGVKFCKYTRGLFHFLVKKNPHFSQRTREMGYPGNPHSNVAKSATLEWGTRGAFDNSLLRDALCGCTMMKRWNEF